ncbi:efflux system, outer membrane component [Sulfurimonas gotlandica GD1]|jgi:outer membrane protein|uniref:Efflux system, outer membrane component n=1 Tax=Sulfurimonas gotlandica (strain DSM 19862 / JCM 16533 / GD1) TaxID=929558 RepID=B6BMY0_SULGG|nr:TolC family protein [Sulfurimonas gotlandica]EDZ61615.1 outer membrane efflux protein [Sulfurimonas gotlandica GD1]EHP30747.1 efflux system, outer membrane component [Sulfurimonas gotlandica GD1]
MNKLILLIIPAFIYAESLKSLLDYATENSDLVVSKTLTQKAKASEVESRESAYFPTIDAGAFYQSLDEKTPMQAGDVYSGFAKVSFDIYDGGKKSSQLSQTENEYKASSFDSESTKKSLSLQIVQDFFNIKSLKASLASREEARKSLLEQLTRMQRFYAAKVATSDDVDRLQAAYDTNIYEMESIKFQIVSAKKSLELKVGKNIETLDDSKFREFSKQTKELIDSVKSLMAKKDALVDGAESVDSAYYPQLKIEDTFSVYGYERSDALHPEGVDNQNKLLLSLNMRIFDYGTVAKSKQALIINSQALNTQVSYFKKEQAMRYDLALSAIETSNIKIKSAKSALVSATSAFKTISKKYDAGIVDNIVYLDALSSQTEAKALYETSMNDLEIAYAAYYYYAGKKIEEFLK